MVAGSPAGESGSEVITASHLRISRQRVQGLSGKPQCLAPAAQGWIQVEAVSHNKVIPAGQLPFQDASGLGSYDLFRILCDWILPSFR